MNCSATSETGVNPSSGRLLARPMTLALCVQRIQDARPARQLLRGCRSSLDAVAEMVEQAGFCGVPFGREGRRHVEREAVLASDPISHCCRCVDDGRHVAVRNEDGHARVGCLDGSRVHVVEDLERNGLVVELREPRRPDFDLALNDRICESSLKLVGRPASARLKELVPSRAALGRTHADVAGGAPLTSKRSWRQCGTVSE